MNRLTLLMFSIILSLSLAITTAIVQFEYHYRVDGYNFVYVDDYGRHIGRINGSAVAPYRYRILTEYAIERIVKLFRAQDNHERARIYEKVVWGVRIFQNIAIFLLALWYFRTLKISLPFSLVGLLFLAYGMCFAFFASDLSVYLYTQIVFFLLAAVLINLQKDNWIIPLTILAALNREEAVFIPVLLVASRIIQVDFKSPDRRFLLNLAIRSLLSFVGFFVVYWGLRYVLGPAPYSHSRYGNIYPGILLMQLNALNRNTWVGLLEMYNGLPLFLILFKKWPSILKSYFVFLAVPWFMIEFAFGSADETRLFLVPLFIVFVPATLAVLPKLNVNLQENRI